MVGLFGPSCSGKSSFLRALQEKLDFYIPVGITTRPKRAEENGDLEHINDLEFIERAQKDSLCFMAKVSGYYYAYPIINPSIRNIAIEIRRENIPELKTYNGVVIKVIPCKLEEEIGRILSKRKQGTRERMEELILEYNTSENDPFDLVFNNNYDDQSISMFLGIVEKFVMK